MRILLNILLHIPSCPVFALVFLFTRSPLLLILISAFILLMLPVSSFLPHLSYILYPIRSMSVYKQTQMSRAPNPNTVFRARPRSLACGAANICRRHAPVCIITSPDAAPVAAAMMLPACSGKQQRNNTTPNHRCVKASCIEICTTLSLAPSHLHLCRVGGCCASSWLNLPKIFMEVNRLVLWHSDS